MENMRRIINIQAGKPALVEHPEHSETFSMLWIYKASNHP